VVIGYVVMPEHVHLLVNEPKVVSLDRVIQALKLSVSVREKERPFWQARYYYFNVFSTSSKLRSCATCTVTLSLAVWLRSRKIGLGPVSVITQPG